MKFQMTILLAIFITAVLAQHGRIFGGFEVSRHSIPFIVRLNIKLSTRIEGFGGSIIHPRVIMTAAHCIANNGDSYEIEGL